MTEPTLLFVYGTLRPGANHTMGDWLWMQAEWLGPAWLPAARLYRVDWYPAVMPGVPQEMVRGDVYRLLNDTAWITLDAFEGVYGSDDDEYLRNPTHVRLEDGRELLAWVYWYQRPVESLEWLPHGDWLQVNQDA